MNESDRSSMNLQIGGYAEYKDSGVAWLGELPSHWTAIRGKDLFRRLDRSVAPDAGVVTCFRDGTVTLRTNRRTTGFTEAIQEHGYQGVRAGDLVIHAMDAFAGAVGVSDSDGKCTPMYAVCEPKMPLKPEYYASLVREMARRGWILALARGIRERSTDFRFDTFGSQTFPYPPFDEQAAIVKYLAHVDRKIDRFIRSKRRMIELLNEQKQAIIHQAVTKGLDPSVPMKDSGVEWLGEIPAHWEVRRLKSMVGTLEQGWSPQCESFPAGIDEWGVLKVGCVNRDAFDSSQNKRLPDDLNPIPQLEVTSGDILVSRANTKELVGLAALVDMAPSKLILSDKLFRFHPHEATVDPYFLVLAIRDRSSRSQIEASTNGASDSMQNIGQSVIRNLWVAVPGIQEQRDIVLCLDRQTSTLTSTIRSAEREIGLVREYRARLISDVVTGKLDVRGAQLGAMAGLVDAWAEANLGDVPVELNANPDEE